MSDFIMRYLNKLVLVPTPIDDKAPLEKVACEVLKELCLQENVLILVEELKENRRSWIRFGLPKEAIEKFIVYNEHTSEKENTNILKALSQGKTVFLLSDCGLPAFHDPGAKLVELCHQSGHKVTATPFANSISLAIALSGLDHKRFVFEGFLSAKSDLRAKAIKALDKIQQTVVLMDTPYRLNKLLDELAEAMPNREAFLATNLNYEDEKLYRGDLRKLKSKVPKEKKEFILLLGAKNVR